MCVAHLQAGDASGTGLFDPAKRDYDPTRLASIDSELHNKFPELITPNEVGLMVLQYNGCRCGLWCWPGCTSRPSCGSQLFRPWHFQVCSSNGHNMPCQRWQQAAQQPQTLVLSRRYWQGLSMLPSLVLQHLWLQPALS